MFSSAEDLVEWLVSTLDELKKQPPAAADLDVLKKQIDDHMVFLLCLYCEYHTISVYYTR